MKVSVAIVTYNAIKYLDDCLKSIFSQTFKDFKVLVIDNASEDGTVEHLRKNYPQVTVLQNFKNLGLAKAYNQAIKFWESEYVLLANQDIILQLDFLEKLIKVAAHHPAAASFGGKILKLSHDEDKRDLGPEIIDTTGIVATKSRRFYDRGAGEEDKGQYDQAGEIFGLSANLVLYRREALEKVKIKNLKNREGFKFTTTFDYYE
jgi:GT2 family glycosyltransferase